MAEKMADYEKKNYESLDDLIMQAQKMQEKIQQAAESDDE